MHNTSSIPNFSSLPLPIGSPLSPLMFLDLSMLMLFPSSLFHTTTGLGDPRAAHSCQDKVQIT